LRLHPDNIYASASVICADRNTAAFPDTIVTTKQMVKFRNVAAKPNDEGFLSTEESLDDSDDYPDIVQPGMPYRFLLIRWVAPPRSDGFLMGIRALAVTQDEAESHKRVFEEYDNLHQPEMRFPMAIVPFFSFFQFPPPATPDEVASEWAPPIDAERSKDTVRSRCTTDMLAIPDDPDLTDTLKDPSNGKPYTEVLFMQITPPQCCCNMLKIRGIFTSNGKACSYAYLLRKEDEKGLQLSQYTHPVRKLRECPLIPGQCHVKIKKTESDRERATREKHTREFHEKMERNRREVERMDIQKAIVERDAELKRKKQSSREKKDEITHLLELIRETDAEHREFAQRSGMPFSDPVYTQWKTCALDRIRVLEECKRRGVAPPPPPPLLTGAENTQSGVTPNRPAPVQTTTTTAGGNATPEQAMAAPEKDAAETQSEEDAGDERPRRPARVPRSSRAAKMRGKLAPLPPEIAAKRKTRIAADTRKGGTGDGASDAGPKPEKIDLEKELKEQGLEHLLPSTKDMMERLEKEARGRRDKLAALRLYRAKLAHPIRSKRLQDKARAELLAKKKGGSSNDRVDGQSSATPSSNAVEQVIIERPEDLASLPADVKVQMREYFEKEAEREATENVADQTADTLVIAKDKPAEPAPGKGKERATDV